MRRTANRSEGEPFEVEIEPEAGDRSRSVPTKSTAGRSVGLVALGVVMGVLVTLTVTRDDGQAGSGPLVTTTTTASPPPTTVSAPIITSPSPPTTAPSGLPVLPLGHPTGIVLYLTPDGGAPVGLTVYDVDRGQTRTLSLERDVGWYVRALDAAGGVVVDGGEVVAVAQGQAKLLDNGGEEGIAAAPLGRTAPGPNGTLWLRRSAPAEIDQLDAAGESTGFHVDLPLGSDLYGSMADGRPVVRGEDGRVIAVGLDGQRTLLAPSALGRVENGRFGEARCDVEQQCRLIAHVDNHEADLGSTRSANGTARQLRFQPDGPLVAVFDSTRLTLIDTTASRTVAVVTDLELILYGNEEPPLRFLPDGAGLVVTTRTGLTFLDLTGKRIATAAFNPGNMPGPLLLGVGHATPRQSP